MSQLRWSFFHIRCDSPILRISAVGILLTVAGACDKLGLGSSSPTAPTAPAAGSTIVYTAIGASDANGVGSSSVCVPFTDCPNGMGYVPVGVRQLRARGFVVSHLNMGIPTAVIGRDFEALGQQYNRFIAGNFIEQEVPFIQQTATVVTVFAGLNEVNTITAALGAGAGGANPNGFIDVQVRAFGTDYATLLGGIAARAGSPRIVLLNVPNPAGMPYLAGASLPQRQAAQRAGVGMTRAVNALASQTIFIVDLMCDARSYAAATYSSDGLHPNDNGYAFIASEMVRAITASTFPAPQATCGPMTLVP